MLSPEDADLIKLIRSDSIISMCTRKIDGYDRGDPISFTKVEIIKEWFHRLLSIPLNKLGYEREPLQVRYTLEEERIKERQKMWTNMTYPIRVRRSYYLKDEDI